MPAKILLVDDGPETLSLMESILKDRGFDVMTAQNGSQGLQRIKQDKPHLIILDVLMPEMDGFVFFKEIKKAKETENIPIFILTVRARMEDTFRALGVEEFMVKPFDTVTLFEKIDSRLGFQRSPETSPPKSEPPKEPPKVSTPTIKVGVGPKVAAGPKKFLVVGTSDTVVNRMVSLLQEKNCQAHAAAKPAAMMEQLSAFKPDIIILEVLLNGRPSEEIVTKIKGLPGFKDTPIVLFSFVDKSRLDVSLHQMGANIDNARRLCLKAGATESIGGFEEGYFLSVMKKYF